MAIDATLFLILRSPSVIDSRTIKNLQPLILNSPSLGNVTLGQRLSLCFEPSGKTNDEEV